MCENEKQNNQSGAKLNTNQDQLNNLGLGYMWNDQSNLNSCICLPIIEENGFLFCSFINHEQGFCSCELHHNSLKLEIEFWNWLMLIENKN